MKKLVFILIIIFNFSPSGLFLIDDCCSQWVEQNSGTTSVLRSIKFINRWTGWTVGDNSTILKTTNGGINWVNIPNPTSGKPLHMVSVIDSNHIYVVGSFSTIIKSSNGGINWTVIMNWPVGQGNTYQGVFFLNRDTGWVCGQGESGFGNVLFTKNGFQSFDSSYTLGGYHSDIYFKNINNGIVIGDGGTLFYTTNSGYNWLAPNIQLYGTLSNFYRMSFVNNNIGWLQGSDGRVFKTTDFGLNWDSISYNGVINAPQYCIEFVDSLIGWSVGGSCRILHSTDGGITWEIQYSLGYSYIRDIFMYDNNTGWCVGGSGRILHTTNGGTTTGIEKENVTYEKKLYLEQNYPNPFNSTTIIQFQVPSSKFVKLVVYDLLGREISTLVNEYKQTGNYEIRFDASKLTSGIYYYTLLTDKFRESKRMILLK